MKRLKVYQYPFKWKLDLSHPEHVAEYQSSETVDSSLFLTGYFFDNPNPDISTYWDKDIILGHRTPCLPAYVRRLAEL